MMDSVDPFEDIYLPPNTSVGLKEGININDLSTGTVFEVDMETVAKETKEDDSQFKGEEVWHQLNSECTLENDDDEDDNEEDGTAPFMRMERKMEDLTGDCGILKKVLRTGIGHVIPEQCIIRVHYNGYLEYSDEPYDSTRLRNQPLQVRLGNQEVIPGLELGMITMRKTEIARFLVKPEYAFGKMGCPPRIPPDATIMFEVELLSFVENKAVDDYHTLSGEEKHKMSIEEIIEVADAEREIGNDSFEQKIYGKAAKHYSKAIRILEPAHLKDEKEERSWNVALLKLYLNLSLCDIKQCKSTLAITHCRRALELDSKNVKATFRLGQAYMQLSEWDKSKDYLLRAVHLAPNNTEIRQELAKLNRKIQQFELLEKKMYSRMFNSPSGNHSEDLLSKQQTLTLTDEVRTVFKEKLISFKENVEMRELVLPEGTSKEEVECIAEIAEDLGMICERSDKKSSYTIKITKPDMPEFED